MTEYDYEIGDGESVLRTNNVALAVFAASNVGFIGPTGEEYDAIRNEDNNEGESTTGS